jgi:hypothetical protein
LPLGLYNSILTLLDRHPVPTVQQYREVQKERHNATEPSNTDEQESQEDAENKNTISMGQSKGEHAGDQEGKEPNDSDKSESGQ